MAGQPEAAAPPMKIAKLWSKSVSAPALLPHSVWQPPNRCVVYTAVRVRPPLQPSDPGFDLIPHRFQRSMVHVASPTSISVDSPQGRKLFIFDQVFGADAQQEKVWDYVHDSVDAFIQGFNVSVLAYGQSGSGKSYTMGTSGPAEQGDSHLMGQSIPFQTAITAYRTIIWRQSQNH